ncbi:MAG: baeRF10 domain-containing protein [Planctomycetota bacterium]
MTKQRIYPPTSASLSRLAMIEGDDRCVLTVYFPGSLTTGPKAANRLAELPGSLLKAESLTADEAEHLRRSLDLWHSAVRKVDFPGALGWVGVVSWLTEEVALMQLPVAMEPAAYLDNSPFLLAAARLLDDFEAYAVVYADHARATIYLAALGKLKEESRLRGEIKNHVRKGGWSQQRYERRRDKEIHYYCRAMLERLKELIESEGVRRIVLAGDRILLGELEKRMSAAMRKQVVCRLAMEGKKEPHEIFRETLSSAAKEEQREERWLRDAILNEHGAGGRAVVGIADTLAALKDKRVRWLLIGPMESVDFWRCPGCGSFGLGQHPACPKCSESTYTQSAANEFLDLAFAGGSRVELTGEDLAELGGVGALLRW